jgi:glycosyltransferase involved in cell wall biosynthesis
LGWTAEATEGVVRILQTQKPRTPPYSDHAHALNDELRALEKFALRFVPKNVAEAAALFWRRRQFDAVVTTDYRTSVLYGALTNLFGGRALHVVKELYLDERTLESPFRRRVFRWSLRRCACVVANCSAEIAAYSSFLGLPPERFRFIPWPSNLATRADAGDDGSIFAAGRSFRDWPTLFAAARRIDAPVVVVAEGGAVAGLVRPDNVEIHCDVHRDRYLELLGRAQMVVVPLRPTVRSVGQAALLEAMALSKPVVTACIPGVADYVAEEENGVYYEAGDARSLADQINRLRADRELRRRLGAGGRHAVDKHFNRHRYSHDMTQLMGELLRTAHGSNDDQAAAARPVPSAAESRPVEAATSL